MAIDENASVIGVFRDRTMAEQAIQQLHQSGWEDNQIRMFRGHNSGGVFSSLKQALGGHDENATDSLDQLDLSADQRQFYQRELDLGYMVVSVQSHDRQLDVREILQRNGAYNILLPAELGGRERIVPIRQEEVEVHKEVVQTGEIRIHKRVITENRTFTVPVMREEVIIERLPFADKSAEQVDADQQDTGNMYAVHHPVGMAGNEADPAGNEALHQEADRARSGQGYEDEMLKEGGMLRIFVREERVKIEKYTVTVEEIVVRKELLQEERRIIEPVRHEEVTVEHSGNIPLHISGFEAL